MMAIEESVSVPARSKSENPGLEERLRVGPTASDSRAKFDRAFMEVKIGRESGCDKCEARLRGNKIRVSLVIFQTFQRLISFDNSIPATQAFGEPKYDI